MRLLPLSVLWLVACGPTPLPGEVDGVGEPSRTATGEGPRAPLLLAPPVVPEFALPTPAGLAAADQPRRDAAAATLGRTMHSPAVVLVAPTPASDSGAGVEPGDAGVEPGDAGVEPGDAGVEPGDAGVEPGDAGAEPGDAGGEPGDAGVEPGDAGVVASPADDAGTAALDAGAAGGPLGLDISPHLALGVPDESGVGRLTMWLLVKPQFVVSYDSTRKTPRWTSWELQSSWLGTADRTDSFRMDPELPADVPQARTGDYTNSGFDRGHLCPSADRTATSTDNYATFTLTNVVPQTHASNAGPWLSLENEARALAAAGKKLVIIAGPIFSSAPGTIGTGVAVPTALFKVLVALDATPSPGAVATSTRVYAAIVPNAAVLSGSWRSYQVTVQAVEDQTGLDFLSDVPGTLQEQLERRLDP